MSVILFDKPPSPFSYWTRCVFRVDNIKYTSVEQYILAEKARLFGDGISRTNILRQSDPLFLTHIGRTIKGFKESVWLQHQRQIMIKGNLAKFLQNPVFKKELLDTGNAILGQVSDDLIRGTGVYSSDPSIWKGKNLNGQVLMRVRQMISKHRE